MAEHLKTTKMEKDFREGENWEQGYAVERDFGRAAACYERAASAGHAEAMFRLALVSYYAFEDNEKALHWARRAADAGYKKENQSGDELVKRFSAGQPLNGEYYFDCRLEFSHYDHVVYSGMSRGWRYNIGRARTCARQMAETLGLDFEKAETLAVLKGRTLLPFGPAGTKYIRELAARDGIVFDECALCLAIARDALAGHFRRMTEDLRAAILRLYQRDGENAAGGAQEESRIIVYVYDMLYDYELLREKRAMTEKEWEKECRAASEASARAGKPLPFVAIAEKAKPYVKTPPHLPDAEREYLDIVWAYYKEYGARGVDQIRRVTAADNQGERVVDIRRLGRRTPNGRRIETYKGEEAPKEYRLKICMKKTREDLVYGGMETFSKSESHPILLGGRVSMHSLDADIVELLCADGDFVGAGLDITLPTDVRSLVQRERRETLLMGQEKRHGYGGGNDDFDVSYGFVITIEKDRGEKSADCGGREGERSRDAV